ncbi:MAG: hypothetical protein IPO81_13725 [Kouleothrix sp.]|nr:hypothetical protein [Kouleothrix sp.]
MKIFPVAIAAIFSLILVACGSEKSECPPIPIYPDAQNIGYKQVQSTQRITSYRTSTSQEKVFEYYEDQLRSHGWEPISNTSKGFTFGYTSSPSRPPFTLSVVIVATQLGETDYDVYLTIAGPFAGFDRWCTSLKP